MKPRLSLTANEPAAPMTLSAARCGERLRVVCVRGESPECVRLREMGFNEAAEVCKVTDGGALICQLSGVRLAIARKLGADVMVERIQP